MQKKIVIVLTTIYGVEMHYVPVTYISPLNTHQKYAVFGYFHELKFVNFYFNELGSSNYSTCFIKLKNRLLSSCFLP